MECIGCGEFGELPDKDDFETALSKALRVAQVYICLYCQIFASSIDVGDVPDALSLVGAMVLSRPETKRKRVHVCVYCAKSGSAVPNLEMPYRLEARPPSEKAVFHSVPGYLIVTWTVTK